MIAADDDGTGSSVVKLNITEGTGITITDGKETTIAAKLATAAAAGVVELGNDTVQTVAANSVSAIPERTYAIQQNSVGQLVGNVPWTAYTNHTLTFQDSSVDRATFNTLNSNTLTDINFTNAISAALSGGILSVSDVLATGSSRGTVIAGRYSGTNDSSTVSRYNGGYIDVDIDCGTWS